MNIATPVQMHDRSYGRLIKDANGRTLAVLASGLTDEEAQHLAAVICGAFNDATKRKGKS